MKYEHWCSDRNRDFVATIIVGLMVVFKFGVTIYSPRTGDFKSPSFARLALIYIYIFFYFGGLTVLIVIECDTALYMCGVTVMHPVKGKSDQGVVVYALVSVEE
jgi:hypothetical protein